MINKTIYQVDSFTDEIFKGNPAGVMILDSEIDPETMQQIANEMNLSETAFVLPYEEKFKIRYFTPTIEVPICGHATLASAHILYSLGLVKKDSEIQFIAKLDDLKVKYENDWIKMSFPRFDISQADIPEHLDEAIGLDIAEFYIDPKNDYCLAYIQPDTDLSDLKPNIELIGKIVSGVLIVTSHDYKRNYDFLVRCFAPNMGINEDPVTGAANCILSTFWKEKLNKSNFISRQMSNRTGIIKTRVSGDRVEICGKAKTVFKAELMIY